MAPSHQMRPTQPRHKASAAGPTRLHVARAQARMQLPMLTATRPLLARQISLSRAANGGDECCRRLSLWRLVHLHSWNVPHPLGTCWRSAVCTLLLCLPSGHAESQPVVRARRLRRRRVAFCPSPALLLYKRPRCISRMRSHWPAVSTCASASSGRPPLLSALRPCTLERTVYRSPLPLLATSHWSR